MNNTVNALDLEIYRHVRAFSRIEHILGHKTRLSKFIRTEIIQSTFSDDSGMKLEVNDKRTFGKFTHI